MSISILKQIFSNFRYILLSCIIFSGMIFLLSLISEYLFLTPYVIGHIQPGSEFGLALIIIISILSGLVIPMNVYRIFLLKNSKTKIGGSLLGSFIGATAGACSCGPIGFTIISTFGTVGSVTSSFLTNYEIPIRIIATGILVLTFYTTLKSINIECRLIKK